MNRWLKEWSLYLKIDKDQLRGLNAVEGSVMHPFKSRAERLDKERFVESNIDEQLIIHVP